MSIFEIICYSASFILFIGAFVLLYTSKKTIKEEKIKATKEVMPTIIYRVIFFLGVI